MIAQGGLTLVGRLTGPTGQRGLVLRDSGVRGSLSKVIDSLAAGHPFSIVHLLEFESQRRILFK
jgi:hypothetical protein